MAAPNQGSSFTSFLKFVVSVAIVSGLWMTWRELHHTQQLMRAEFDRVASRLYRLETSERKVTEARRQETDSRKEQETPKEAENPGERALGPAAQDRQSIQLVDRFSHALELLGHDDVSVRGGALYAIEQIGLLDKSYYWPMIEIFTARLRNREVDPGQPPSDIPLDTQIMLTIIGRRDSRLETYGMRIDLSNAPLAGANLREMDFHGANLSGSDLHRADLSRGDLRWTDLHDADLRGATLSGARLGNSDVRNARFEGANLSATNLRGLDLSDRDLTGVDFRGAKFQETKLRNANLKNANLSGADLSQALGLTRAQISEAISDEWTVLPPDLTDAPKRVQE